MSNNLEFVKQMAENATKSLSELEKLMDNNNNMLSQIQEGLTGEEQIKFKELLTLKETAEKRAGEGKDINYLIEQMKEYGRNNK